MDEQKCELSFQSCKYTKTIGNAGEIPLQV